MQKIIEDIYYGRLSVSEQTYPKGSQYDETLSEVVKLAEDLQNAAPVRTSRYLAGLRHGLWQPGQPFKGG